MINDKYIEQVARAICTEDDRNPDIMVARFDNPDKQVGPGDCWSGERHELWREYVTIARRSIAAYNAINQILRGETWR